MVDENQSRRDSGSADLAMYDRSIQTLFGIGLRLEYCLALLDPDAEQISTALNDVMDDIAELTVDLRTRIYQLR